MAFILDWSWAVDQRTDCSIRIEFCLKQCADLLCEQLDLCSSRKKQTSQEWQMLPFWSFWHDNYKWLVVTLIKPYFGCVMGRARSHTNVLHNTRATHTEQQLALAFLPLLIWLTSVPANIYQVNVLSCDTEGQLQPFKKQTLPRLVKMPMRSLLSRPQSRKRRDLLATIWQPPIANREMRVPRPVAVWLVNVFDGRAPNRKLDL